MGENIVASGYCAAYEREQAEKLAERAKRLLKSPTVQGDPRKKKLCEEKHKEYSHKASSSASFDQPQPEISDGRRRPT